MPISDGLTTPILLVVFNRPETTKTVVESIRAVRPADLYVVADGPRPDVEGESLRCNAARQVATNIDWDCRVHKLFRDRNLGSGLGVASAIDWFFENVQDGIVLEDDCVPSRSFFRFCEELLGYYRDNPRVMHISGNNFQYGRRRGTASYYFSRYTHTWGWASWRRAWQHYDFDLIPESDRSHVWDAQWLLSVEKQRGMAVLPNVNLVTNIGFGPAATHTKTIERYALLPAEEMEFPLRHPKELSIDRAADTLTQYANFRNIRNLRLIWVYQVIDFIALVPSRVGKLLVNVKHLGRQRS
jgi:hypothetical protein